MSPDIDAALANHAGLPLVITRLTKALDCVAWARENRAWVLQQLRAHGALLLRDFAVDLTNFRQLVAALSDSIEPFAEESSPRSSVAPDVFTSTDYPSTYPIQFHNEFSYSSRWPLKLFFCCLREPQRDGSTPIADCRRVLSALSSATREKFGQHGVLYKRNFFPYMGVSWRTAFGTSDAAVVEQYCSDNDIEVAWDKNGTLRTTSRRAAIVRHPHGEEDVWFNHGFFFNVRAIEPPEVRRALLTQPEAALSTNTYFGNGDLIKEEVIDELRTAYNDASAQLPWRRGDVLFIDNMLVAHGRRPYSGERKIVVAMSDPCLRKDLSAQPRSEEP
jgi:alpha-ketoglutarate-dependent taurine dioxygenase